MLMEGKPNEAPPKRFEVDSGIIIRLLGPLALSFIPGLHTDLAFRDTLLMESNCS